MPTPAALKRPKPQPAPALPFHPAVSTWFLARFGEPTEVQARAWAVATQRRHALIAAPTGSGKTLAAFLSAINELVVQGLAGPLDDAVQVLYVSPLKALSNDIRKNLQEPLAGIRAQLQAMGLPDVGIRDAVRTGDTPTAERERMRRTPPHILVTTPESLFILLTSKGGRAMLAGVKSVIVDELHAVAGSKRGAHLMLSLERLSSLAQAAPVRIGLSATVKPLDEMARFLVGDRHEDVAVIDTGHVRRRDLALEMPLAPLGAVMATEVWGEVYDRLATLVASHRTTLIFVNQRRGAERAARHLAERLGEEHVTAHHGSLSREHRLQAEQRLKAGTRESTPGRSQVDSPPRGADDAGRRPGGPLKVLVATSSLELGIDIGDVDLVCQLGSPRGINAFLQRVGRAGHAVGAVPKGRLFPLALDDLLECTALLDAVGRGELDRIRVPPQPMDVLAQQIVAEVACREWSVEALFALYRRAWSYRDLTRPAFDAVVQMLADGYATRRGRRGAYLHLDAVNGLLRARRGAQLTAVTNAGVIPDQFDYDVVLLPEAHRVGTLNEDFAFESLPGDIFQLGNTSYRIVKIETGKVLVEDAKGQPPSMPFWFGDALGRSDELSHAVSRLADEASAWMDAEPADDGGVAACEHHLRHDHALDAAAARQLSHYLGTAKAALGELPSEHCIVFERFFDDVGDTHLVIHSPFGSRINRAWGLALRKRFCRRFDFELQASALEDSIVLSLGPTHSFPLDEVQHYLKAATAKDVLTQALLAAPMFGTRWRWNATAALAVRRMSGGRKVPPQFQRSDAEDLLTVVFPDQQACADNLAGERELPEHPLVAQTVSDCLHETMDVDGLVRLLARIEAGEVRVVTRDLTTPSPLSLAILSARPYAFLDDGAAEERRTQAVRAQPLQDALAGARTAADLGRLDPAAIAMVREQARPAIGNADELHDALVVHGCLTEAEVVDIAGADAVAGFVAMLQAQRRVTRLHTRQAVLLIAAERLHEWRAVAPQSEFDADIAAVSAHRPEPDAALREIMRGRLDLLGPVAADDLATPLGLDIGAVQGELLRLEAEGTVMRGAFTAPQAEEWCERRLLARIHRATRDAHRASVQAVSPAAFMRFLFRWHQLPGSGEPPRAGEGGLAAVLRQLEGVAVPAAAWEDELLAARVADYEPGMLDKLCATGRIVWWRPVRGGAEKEGAAEARPRTGLIRVTPVLLCEREALPLWQQALWQRENGAGDSTAEPAPVLSGKAQRVLDALRSHGASFFAELQQDAHLLGTELEGALAELVSQGLATCDSFAGLRALVMPAEVRQRLARRRQRHRLGSTGAELGSMQDAGRWSLTRRPRALQEAGPGAAAHSLAAPEVEHIARVLLRRYGVVFRKLLEREADGLPPWRDLHYVLRRLEARGEVRGGRFVTGFAGEQFALPEAAAALVKTARDEGGSSDERVSLCAADPLNLAGILTPGDKVPRLPGHRLLYERGVPVALLLGGGELRYLRPVDEAGQWVMKQQLIVRPAAALQRMG
jgi:ATP-dependent Lhr-like helicase